MNEHGVSMRFNPDESTELDKIVRGSYDDFVRLERRNLLASSAITLIFFFGNVEPTEIVYAGVSFPAIDTRMLFFILFFICLYFLAAYMIYAYPGFRDVMSKWKALKAKGMQIVGDRHRWSIEWKNFLSNTRYALWLFFNYALPILVGVSALVVGACKIF